MRAVLTVVFGAGLLCCLAVAQGPPTPEGASAAAAGEQDARLITVAYKIGDLPVWDKDGAFNPDLLMWVIESSVKPESWEALGGASTMAPYAKSAALVVSTTADNHKAVEQLLQRLRR